MRAIIADDSDIFRVRLISLLQEISGFCIESETVNAPETIQTVKMKEPDLLLLDIQMPGGSGIDVLKELKKANKLPKTVVILTNYPYPQYKERCLSEGAHYFLDKTNEVEEIIKIIENLMADNPTAGNANHIQ